MEIPGYWVKIYNLKDLRNNQTILELQKNTSENEQLILLHMVLSYLLEPCYDTLQNLVYIIIEKSKTIPADTLYRSFQFNWQVEYIVTQLQKGILENDILEAIKKWGNNYEDYLAFESKLNDVNSIINNLDYLDLVYIHQSINKNSLFDFFNNFYKKSKSNFSTNLLVIFILTSRNMGFEKEKLIFDDELIEEIIRIINEENIENHLRVLGLVIIIGIVEAKRILTLNINFEIPFFEGSISIIAPDIVASSCRNILKVINIDDKKYDLIKVLFLIKAGRGRHFYESTDNNSYSMFLDLDYGDNHHIRMLGYLLSLLDFEIYNDATHMKKISDFLISQLECSNNTFEYIRNIIINNKLNNDLMQTFLVNMYSYIKKENIKNCSLAAQYENDFKTIFENKIIGL